MGTFIYSAKTAADVTGGKRPLKRRLDNRYRRFGDGRSIQCGGSCVAGWTSGGQLCMRFGRRATHCRWLSAVWSRNAPPCRPSQADHTDERVHVRVVQPQRRAGFSSLQTSPANSVSVTGTSTARRGWSPSAPVMAISDALSTAITA